MSGNQNLHAVLEAGFGDDEATAFSQRGGETLSYGALRRNVARMANALEGLGVKPGDRITVQVEKSLANVFLYLAALKVGAIYNPLNTAYTPAELDYFIGDAEPALMVADPAAMDALAPIAKRHDVPQLLTLDPGGNGSLADAAATAGESHETVAASADDVCALVYTSGTTGRSKGAMVTHGNLSSNARTLHKLWRFEPGDRLLHALPIFHVHGLMVALHTGLLNGSEFIWLPKYDVGEVIAALPRATVMMGVPTHYTRLLGDPAFTGELAGNMRLFISGSAPLLAETHDDFTARSGHRILERYGMSETGMITSNPYDGDRIAGTVGHALPGVSLRVAGEDGAEVGPGEVGVVQIRGPNVFKGYWRNSEKTREAFTLDDWFITGDLGTLDGDGRLTLVGRGSDLIISGGLNIYPKEIEDEINLISGIGESAVIGVPHPDFGEAVVAVVTGGDGDVEQAVDAALSDRLARFKQPKRVFRTDALPRNAMGKVQKSVLRDQFRDLFKG